MVMIVKRMSSNQDIFFSIETFPKIIEIKGFKLRDISQEQFLFLVLLFPLFPYSLKEVTKVEF